MKPIPSDCAIETPTSRIRNGRAGRLEIEKRTEKDTLAALARDPVGFVTYARTVELHILEIDSFIDPRGPYVDTATTVQKVKNLAGNAAAIAQRYQKALDKLSAQALEMDKLKVENDGLRRQLAQKIQSERGRGLK